MKKIAILLSLILIAHVGFAQIDISENDFPKPGELWNVFTDYTDNGYVITPGSATAQQWDYSKVFNTDATGSELFQSPSAVPFSSSFPGATVAIDASTFQEYYTVNSSGFYLIGEHYSPQFVLYTFDTLQTFNPQQLQMPCPLAYGQMEANISKSVVTGYDDSIKQYVRVVTYTSQTYNADAFGTLTTPGITNASVLRVKDFTVEHDTTYSSPTINGTYTPFDTDYYNYDTYYFVHNGPGFMLMEIDYDNVLNIVDIAYYYTSVATGINSAPAQSEIFTSVYPNPARSMSIAFVIQGNNAQWLKIYNMVGECVQTENVTGLNTLTISNPFLKSGIYLYQVTDKNGAVLGGKEFIIQ